MDCCNYPEYRAQYAWECAGGYAPYAPLQYGYAPPCYAPHAHDPYARYGPAAAATGAGAYHYDYRAHHLAALPPDHGLSMEVVRRRLLRVRSCPVWARRRRNLMFTFGRNAQPAARVTCRDVAGLHRWRPRAARAPRPAPRPPAIDRDPLRTTY
ncbi:hypothetical protein EVAR_7643_1 [Eumeta japonica]|uniref:Uncharacterized protein n=1 Tax=Eumeta variegata TaxID=151549 RepID=A0A4C1TJ42_EUMVA|nr:hypothetical protein EVAR_7643_1 [Eumeta japonica]